MFVWLRFIMLCNKHNFWYLDMLEVIPLLTSYMEHFHVAMTNDSKLLFEGMYIYMYINIYKHTYVYWFKTSSCIQQSRDTGFCRLPFEALQGFLLELEELCSQC